MRFQLLMIFFVMVVGVVFADDNLDESKAIEKIELLGGKVMRDETLPSRPVIVVDFRASKKFSNGDFQLFMAFPKDNNLNPSVWCVNH